MGTIRVLKTVRNAGVKRVVMTSNFGAIGYSHKDPTQLITEKAGQILLKRDCLHTINYKPCI